MNYNGFVRRTNFFISVLFFLFVFIISVSFIYFCFFFSCSISFVFMLNETSNFSKNMNMKLLDYFYLCHYIFVCAFTSCLDEFLISINKKTRKFDCLYDLLLISVFSWKNSIFLAFIAFSMFLAVCQILNW